MKRISFSLLFSMMFFWSDYSQAQGSVGINGIVTDLNERPIIGATIYIEELNRGGVSGIDGTFGIPNVAFGDYTLTVNSVGYKELRQSITFNSLTKFSFQLAEDIAQLDNIVIQSNEASQLTKSYGYNVELISAEGYQDLNLDVNQILRVSSGINVRESGGLGSKFDLTLNGLSGNQVRYFIDGIAMENFGSAMTLNNFPANMIRNIEVYKGVVPISLSSDALGGAINITTPAADESFFDATYSFGSFNTHRASIFGQHALTNGLFFRVSSFFNHADNDYWMNHAPVTDKLGNVLGEIKTRRFHDQYTSGLLNIKAGIVEKKLADELSVTVSYAENSNDIQHPEVSVNRVYGGLNDLTRTYLGIVNYKKQWEKLKVSAYFQTSQSLRAVYDTLSRRYNWLQEYTDRSSNTSVHPGEEYDQRSIFKLTDQTFRSNVNLNYSVVENQQLNVNYSSHHMSRSGEDEINLNNLSYTSPNNISKDIIGFSYNLSAISSKLKSSLFGKYYWYAAEINTEEYVDEILQNVKTTSSFSQLGYGLTVSYSLTPIWLLKFSYEKAYRLPDPDEIMGDGLNVLPNPTLAPESSNNINLGAIYSKELGSSNVKSEVNLFLRPANDFIRADPTGIKTTFNNTDNVRSLGVESSTAIKINGKYVLGLNLTYLNITDQTKLDEGLPNTNYGLRLPNIPYFFWNFSAGYRLQLTEERKVSFSWSTRYTHEFFLYWDNLGYKDSKNQITRQLIHDIDINYSFQEGKYNVSASAKNILDAEAYDNFNIQKPGRAFYIKLRYFISKN